MGAVMVWLAAATMGQPPPLSLPCIDAPALPNGVAVSQPLQPVEYVEPLPSGAMTENGAGITSEPGRTSAPVQGPLGVSWERYEYLLWWSNPSYVPPLITAAQGAVLPVLGGPTTVLLAGGSFADAPRSGGGRVTFGTSLNSAQTIGLEAAYLFLGTHNVSRTVRGGWPGSPWSVGRPVIDPTERVEAVVPVAIPGQIFGKVRASASSRLTGWEVNGVANLLDHEFVQVNAILGYRYFQENEGLRIEQWSGIPRDLTGSSRFVSSADQIDAHNRFHGGQMGLSAALSRGSVFLEAVGKVAIGQSTMVVRRSGLTLAQSPGFPLPSVTAVPAAGFVQPSNTGRFVHTAFAVLPETTLRLGYRFHNRSRIYMGYNFIYLSEVVRATEQIDPVIDPNGVPVLGAYAGGTADATVRPLPMTAISDFWVQGLLFGLEYRY